MQLNSLVTIGATAFAASGVLNVFADFTPDSAMRMMNFVGVCLGVLGLQAVYLFSHARLGVMGLTGFLVATMGFMGIAGFLFADAFVFPALQDATAQALFDGATGLAIFGAVILYVLGVVSFAVALFRSGTLPAPALVLWAGGTVPTIAAIALPPAVMTVAEITASIGVVWIAVTILTTVRSDRTSAVV